MIYSFIKWSKTIDNIPYLSTNVDMLDSNGVDVCTRHIEGKCKSHHNPIFDMKYLIDEKSSYLDVESCLSCISFTFSPCFLWRAETYIKALFEFYAESRRVTRRTVSI